jgi:hypothetical protein
MIGSADQVLTLTGSKMTGFINMRNLHICYFSHYAPLILYLHIHIPEKRFKQKRTEMRKCKNIVFKADISVYQLDAKTDIRILFAPDQR